MSFWAVVGRAARRPTVKLRRGNLVAIAQRDFSRVSGKLVGGEETLSGFSGFFWGAGDGGDRLVKPQLLL